MEQQAELGMYLREADDLIESLERGLLALDAHAGTDEVTALFRTTHSIKGIAGMMGAGRCVQLAHRMEGILARLRDGGLDWSPAVVKLLLESVDAVRALVARVTPENPDPGLDGKDELIARLAELSGLDVTDVGASPDAVRTLRVHLAAGPSGTAADIAALVDEIAQYGEILAIEPPRDAPEVRAFRFDLRTTLRGSEVEGLCFSSDVVVTVERLDTAEAVAVQPQPTAQGTVPDKGGTPRGGHAASTVRVDPSRLDEILDTMGELLLALGNVRGVLTNPQIDERERLEMADHIDRLAGEMHGRVMTLRMVPIRETFERMRRPARDASDHLGKEVRIETEGAETELDRKLLEELADPLMHMVRNAVAHGVERPDVRRARGKDPVGTVRLRAMHRDGAAVVEIEDDGAGIDVDRVLQLATARGLVPAGAKLTESEVHAMLCAPGFSTATEVTQIAGRGVGLDVVVSTIERLRGRVDIRSTPGRGTIFRLRLPLTLAVIDAVKVRVGRETISIPVRDVEEVFNRAAATVQAVEGCTAFTRFRGHYVPLLQLAESLGIPDGHDDAGSGRSIVVVRSDRRCFGLAVGEVLGIARSVVKPLDATFEVCRSLQSTYSRPRGIGGATILEDGTIGYLLDVGGLDTATFGASVS